jgi:competence protein ComEC
LKFQYLSDSFFNDFDRWPLWLPVLLGVGISIYFSLPFEPSTFWGYTGLLFFIITLVFARLKVVRLLLLGLGFIALGFSASQYRTHSLNTQMLHYPLKPVLLEGVVSQVEHKPTKAGDFYQRLILTDLKAQTPESLPGKVRLTLKGKKERLWPGQIIRIRAKLTPISEPTLPRGFDFRRQAYFNGIGATGFALSSPEIIGETRTWGLVLERRREEITAYFLDHLPPPKGAIAAALITGDKAGIPEDIRNVFINSSLAHILAISGLHLSIIAGLVFLIIRRGIALIPPLCLYYNSKKIAAVGTIFMTLLYLILSGFGIPAQRAFIMISLVMGAVLINRSALSLRTVAFAAFLILLVTPEALLSPSFQLSFAAVVALITGYEAWKNPLAHYITKGGYIRKFIVYSGGLAFTSFLATLATLPFTIVLFHRFSLHAVEANLLAVPLTSMIIMPSALLTCLLSPLGWGTYPLKVFDTSLDGLIAIAEGVSSWTGSQIWIASPPVLSFLLLLGGGLWISLWLGNWRRWGLLPLIIGLLLMFSGTPPDLLIDGGAKLVGLYQDGLLYVSSNRKGKFTAESWKQALAADSLKPLTCDGMGCYAHTQERAVIITENQNAQKCIPGAILIHLEPTQTPCKEAYLVLDKYDLWKEGSHAIWITKDGYKIERGRHIQGQRPWTCQAIPRKNRPEFSLH